MAKKGERITWTVEREEKLKNLLKEMPLYAAAKQIGLAPNSASQGAKRRGIRIPQRQHNPKPGHPWKRAWPKERQRLFDEAKARGEA